jgi:hypothetical protein
MTEITDAVNQFRSSSNKLWELWIANEMKKLSNSERILNLADRIKKYEALKLAASEYCDTLYGELDD